MIYLRSKGDREPTAWEARLMRWSRKARKNFTPRVEVNDCGKTSIFICDSDLDAWRPLSLWIKEPGTMKWIDSQLHEGDRFLDIGANIGIYSIAAAHRVGDSGRVYAVEPHRVNTLTLLSNVSANKMASRIDVLPLALSDKPGVARFNYVSLNSASTGSQLGRTKMAASTSEREFKPVASETVLSTTIDHLLQQGAIEPPHLVKIDVDGIELSILRGMDGLLRGQNRPRSVQVEVNVGEQETIINYMFNCGYDVIEHAFTKAGAAKIAAGVDPAIIAHNVVFAPRA